MQLGNASIEDLFVIVPRSFELLCKYLVGDEVLGCSNILCASATPCLLPLKAQEIRFALRQHLQQPAKQKKAKTHFGA